MFELILGSKKDKELVNSHANFNLINQTHYVKTVTKILEKENSIVKVFNFWGNDSNAI